MAKRASKKSAGSRGAKGSTLNHRIAALKRLPTGVRGLDKVLDGGLPRGRSTLVLGGPGTGKTVLLNEFLYRGITEFGENGVYVTVEESPARVVTNAATFGWDYDTLLKDKRLAFVDATPEDPSSQVRNTEVTLEYHLTPLVLRLRHAVSEIDARRVVLDSIGALFAQFRSRDAVRHALYYLVDEMQRMGVTTLFSCEEPDIESLQTFHGIEEYVVDGVIKIAPEKGQQSTLRKLEVTKLRGCSYRSGPVEFGIGDGGMTVYPKIESDFQTMGSIPNRRLTSGIADLDKLLGGGYPKGHIVLVTGNTGTGKSLLGMHYLNAALERGESAIFINLEESSAQIKRIAKPHGCDFRAHEQAGRLTFMSPNIIDMTADRLLYEIVETVDRTRAPVLFLDSVSAIPSATYSEEQTRQFLLQLIRFLKSRKVTCLFSHMSSATFGAGHDQRLGAFQTNDMRLASLVDGFILLRYGENRARVAKYLNILKMRGINHDKAIHGYEIKKGVFNISDDDHRTN